MAEERFYTVDSVTDGTAHLVDEEGRTVSVGVHLLPRGSLEGIVVRVSVHDDGTHDWAIATADPVETKRRRTSQQMLRIELERESGERDCE
jgi:hypothetical protein